MSKLGAKDAAELLSISPRVMNYKIKVLGIEFPRGRRAQMQTEGRRPARSRRLTRVRSQTGCRCDSDSRRRDPAVAMARCPTDGRATTHKNRRPVYGLSSHRHLLLANQRRKCRPGTDTPRRGQRSEVSQDAENPIQRGASAFGLCEQLRDRAHSRLPSSCLP